MKIYRYLKHGIKNLIYWFPVIWQDRNFDHYYLSSILRYKLNDMVKYYNGPHAWGVDAPKLAHEMKVCVIILDRIIKDDYNREGYDAHDKKWGELVFDFDTPGNLLLKRSKRVTKEEEEIEQKEYSEIYKKEEEDREKDIETLFDIIRKNIRNWWD